MGVVYRATELALDRPVALKLIAPELADDRSFRERFLRESRLAASLDHPGILPVYAAGEAGGELYLATRYVDGTDLRAILAEDGPLPPERALALVGQVAEALDAAHRRGLVHRDVKPGNVLVDASDHCYLCDFGLTKQLGDGGTTASGLLAGSLDYLAPEQIRRGKVDGRTDQYALACVLYECLSGAPPFRREYGGADALGAHAGGAAPARGLPRARLPSSHAGSRRKLPQRYETCNAFVDDARSALGLGPSPMAVRRRRLRVGRRLVLAGAALIAAAAAAVAFALTLGSEGGIVAPPNSVAAIDPVSRTVVAAIPVGTAPTTVAASDDWVWVINSNDGAGTISRIDPNARRVVRRSRSPARRRPARSRRRALGRDHRGSCLPHRSLLRPRGRELDAAERREVEPLRLRPGRRLPRLRREAVWAASFRAISRIDPTTSRLVPGTKLGLGPARLRIRLALDYRPRAASRSPLSLHAATQGDRRALVRIKRRHHRRGQRLAPRRRGHQVWRVDPEQNLVEDTYEVGGRTVAVAVGAGAVWAPSDDGALVRIDPTTGETERIDVGGAPTGVAVGAGLVWVSVG